MYRCHVCGSNESRQERVNEVFQIEGVPVLVENIPATVCVRCGEATFSRETTETVRHLVHSKAKPVRALQIDVSEYA